MYICIADKTKYLNGETFLVETIGWAKFSSLNQIFVNLSRRKISLDEKFRIKWIFIFAIIIGLRTTVQVIQEVETDWTHWLEER